METISERIRSLMKKREVSYGDLSRMTRIPKSALQRYATGETGKIPLDRVKAIAAALAADPSYLLGWNQDSLPDAKNIFPPGRMKKVPLLGGIACGNPILAEENIESYVDIEEGVSVDFALTCIGDSMIGARIMDGDLVYIHQQPEVENGDIAAVLIDDEATLKRVYYYPGRIILQAENPNFPPMVFQGSELDGVRIIGKAVFFRSAVK